MDANIKYLKVISIENQTIKQLNYLNFLALQQKKNIDLKEQIMSEIIGSIFNVKKCFFFNFLLVSINNIFLDQANFLKSP